MLQDPYSTTRGLAIQAIRAVFPHHSESTDDVLRYRVVQMLTYMLNDSDLANRRLGLGALNSATQHLSGLVLPHIPVLLPYVIQESKIKPELIREVQMGPFKHKVDDGLEVRKVGYQPIIASECINRNALERIRNIIYVHGTGLRTTQQHRFLRSRHCWSW